MTALPHFDRPVATALGELRLRTLTADDAGAFAAHVAGDLPRLGEHLRWPERTRTLDGAARLIAGYADPSDDHRLTAVGVWEGEALIGGALLIGYEPEDGIVEVGVWTTARGAGTGAAAGACRAVIGLARRELGVERVVWRSATDNPASRRLAERLGFVFEGTARSDYLMHGRRLDTWTLSLVGAEIDACLAAG